MLKGLGRSSISIDLTKLGNAFGANCKFVKSMLLAEAQQLRPSMLLAKLAKKGMKLKESQ